MKTENEKLIESLRDDAEAVRKFASRLLNVAREARMNHQVRDAKGLEIGDFFRDDSGHVGVFCGCWGQNMWGRFLDSRHFGYVYPKERMTHEEAMVALAEANDGPHGLSGDASARPPAVPCRAWLDGPSSFRSSIRSQINKAICMSMYRGMIHQRFPRIQARTRGLLTAR